MVFILGAVSILLPVTVEGSELHIQPGITFSEEYTDNVLLTTENRYDDYVTSIVPSLSLLYLAPHWDWDIAYDYQYRYYARATLDDESIHALNVTNRNRIINNILFLEVKDQYTRLSLDVLRDYTAESSFANQSDVNLFTFNPYVVLEALTHMTVTTGYLYKDTWYKEPSAVDRKDHIGYVDVRHDLSPRSAITGAARRTWDENIIEGYTQDDISLGLFHEFGEESTITAKIGNSWIDYETTERTSQVIWDVVLIQRLPTVTVSCETGLRFIADPQGILRREDRYLATIRRDVERNSIVVSGGLLEYREAENKHLENTSYLVKGSISHALTTRSKIILDLSLERLKDQPSGDFTDRYFTGARFEKLIMEDLTLALDYRFSNVYSPDVYLENYANNRFAVEVQKFF
jgi:hypothetical protein